jgi:type VI secretion system protein ImpC
MEGEFRFGNPGSGRPRRRPDTPTLVVVILADLGGRAGRPTGDLAAGAERRLVRVDLDDFDEVLGRLEPRLVLRLGGPDAPEMPIAFRSLDDFHPDALYRRLDAFEPLREMRRRLQDRSTFAAAAAEWSRAVGLATEARPAPARAEGDEAMRRRLLGVGGPEGSGVAPAGSRVPPAAASAQARLEGLLREVVAPHVVPSPDPRLPELLASVDQTTAALLRSILHHPTFQALEATWRSVHGLVTGVETDGSVEMRLLDVTRDQLAAEAAGALERLLGGRGSADEASVWPLFVAGFTFGSSAEDLSLLERLGAIAGRAGGPILAAADPQVVGCRSFGETPDHRDWAAVDGGTAERWRRLREGPSARWIGLAMPRVLLRLPYGTRSDPVSAFDFEELPTGREHEGYLWGNPAFACARLIASAFVENGTDMTPGDHVSLDDVPTAVYDDGGEQTIKPGAETALTDTGAHRILDAGVMPLVASSRESTVRVLRFQSVAHPPRALSGGWDGSA